MAGGVGSRFWPMSTPDYPKQFIDVMGVGRSLIQLTVDRLKPICPVENMWVVTNEKNISIVKEQIRCSVSKDICLYECKNCVVHATDESKVVVQGLNGYIVAEKNGNCLFAL